MIINKDSRLKKNDTQEELKLFLQDPEKICNEILEIFMVRDGHSASIISSKNVIMNYSESSNNILGRMFTIDFPINWIEDNENYKEIEEKITEIVNKYLKDKMIEKYGERFGWGFWDDYDIEDQD